MEEDKKQEMYDDIRRFSSYFYFKYGAIPLLRTSSISYVEVPMNYFLYEYLPLLWSEKYYDRT